MKSENKSDNIMRILSCVGILLAATVIIYFTCFYGKGQAVQNVVAQQTETPSETPVAVAKENTAEPSGDEENPGTEGNPETVADPDGGNGENTPDETPVELTPEEEEARVLEEVYELADTILAEILTEDMTQRDQAWAIFRYVRHNITYKARRSGDTYATSAYDSFAKHVGDCYNFYVASEVLLTRAGIDNIMVQRDGGETHHYWNLVNVGEGWYHFDASPRRVGDPYVCFLQTDAQVAKYNTTYRPDYYHFDPEGLPERATEITYWPTYYTPPVEEPEEPVEPEVPEGEPAVAPVEPEVPAAE